MSALPHNSNSDLPSLGLYHCLSLSHFPFTPNCRAPASLQRLTWELNELALQQWEQCPLFRAKQGTFVPSAPPQGSPLSPSASYWGWKLLLEWIKKPKIIFSFESTADMPSQQGSVSSLSLSVLCFMRPKIYHSNGVKSGNLSSFWQSKNVFCLWHMQVNTCSLWVLALNQWGTSQNSQSKSIQFHLART